jgi:hypothetical protein
MLIPKNSIFNTVPKNLNQRQVFLLEGIRYCANSISFSYWAMYNEIIYISNNNPRENSYYLVFKEAWNLIDSTYRLTNLITAVSEQSPDKNVKKGENFEFLLQTKSFRNTFQHLDERIEEQILKLNAPVWGTISWLKFVNPNLVKSFVLGAGHPRDKFPFRISNPAGQKLRVPIDKITIEAIQRNASEPISSLDLTELFHRTEIIIKKMDQDLEKQWRPQLVHGALPQDLMFCFDIEFPNEEH